MERRNYKFCIKQVCKQSARTNWAMQDAKINGRRENVRRVGGSKRFARLPVEAAAGRPSQFTGNNGEESHRQQGALFVTFEHYFTSLVIVIHTTYLSICYLLTNKSLRVSSYFHSQMLENINNITET